MNLATQTCEQVNVHKEAVCWPCTMREGIARVGWRVNYVGARCSTASKRSLQPWRVETFSGRFDAFLWRSDRRDLDHRKTFFHLLPPRLSLLSALILILLASTASRQYDCVSTVKSRMS